MSLNVKLTQMMLESAHVDSKFAGQIESMNKKVALLKEECSTQVGRLSMSETVQNELDYNFELKQTLVVICDKAFRIHHLELNDIDTDFIQSAASREIESLNGLIDNSRKWLKTKSFKSY